MTDDFDQSDDDWDEEARVVTLPPIVPVFPLTGALLFPETQLPLNIFEPRYLKMVRDAMAGNRLIGMIQPLEDGEPPLLYSIGTVGYISQFKETGDGRLIIVLDGISRFRITQELTVTTPYRQVSVDWSPFELDQTVLEDMEALVDRDALLEGLTSYLDTEGLKTDFGVLEQAPTSALVANLAAALPFDPAEKQALLEAQTVAARAEVMMALFAMTTLSDHETGDTGLAN